MTLIDFPTTQSADDGYVNWTGYSHTQTVLIIGGADPGGNSNYGHGFRFPGVTLTSSDTIDSAYLSLMTQQNTWISTPYRWAVINEDNTAVFSSGSPPGARAIQSTIAAETVNENRVAGTRYNWPFTSTPQGTLATAIAATLARGGWSSGNAIGIVNNSDQDASANTGNVKNYVHAWDSATADSEPILWINYTAGVSGQTITAVAIASGHSLHAATLTGIRTIAAAAIPSGHVLYAGSVDVEAAQQIDAATIPSGHALHAATVTATRSIAAAAIPSGHALHAATLTAARSIAAATIASGHQLHTATLTAERDIAAAIIASGHALHNAAIAETVAAPTNLVATAVSQSQIDVSWTDNAGTETAYIVERSTDGSTGWAVIATLPANTQSYSDIGLDAEATWFYRTKARRVPM